MGLFNRLRVVRAAALACGLACFGPATELMASSPVSPGATAQPDQSDQPFGLSAAVVSDGPLHDKWIGLARKLDDERVQLALCDGDRERCASEAALQFLAIVDTARAREGRAQIGEINRAINLAIHPMSDLAQYGEIDVWSPPLLTFYRAAGDCEDYAIAKFVALREAGVPADDLRIVIMRDIFHGEDHAVAAVKLDAHWLMLDNRRMAMVEDGYVRNYRPLFVIDGSDLKKYVDTPLLAGGPDHDAGPSPSPSSTAQPGLITAAN